MITKTKKPHFVPAAYLQYWDISGNPNGRDSSIFWTDGERCNKQSVKKVAVQCGLYSKKDPNEAENHFNEFESDWSKLIKHLNNGNPSRPEILASLLLLQSSYFLLRNPNFENKSSEERIHVYKEAIEVYWREVLMSGEPKKEHEALKHMLKLWNCHLLIAQEEPWITSDNPVVLLSYKDITPAIIFLPITPVYALIAIKNDALQLTNQKITAEDTSHLNSYSVINSIRHVYSNKEFKPEEVERISKWLERRPNTENWIDLEQIHIEPFVYPVLGMELGFL